MSTTTSNMALKIPTVGDSDYPTSMTTTITLADAHDHTSGKGVQIPTGGIADLAVTTAKIADVNVTTAKIADLNVTRGKFSATALYDTVAASKTGSFTAAVGDDFYPVDCTSGAVTATLPAAASNAGKVFRFKKTDSSVNLLTIDGNSSETIDGSLTKLVAGQYSLVVIECDGTGWHVISMDQRVCSYHLSQAGNAMTAVTAAGWRFNLGTATIVSHNIQGQITVADNAAGTRVTANVPGVIRIQASHYTGNSGGAQIVIKNAAGVTQATFKGTDSASATTAIATVMAYNMIAGDYAIFTSDIDVRVAAQLATIGVAFHAT